MKRLDTARYLFMPVIPILCVLTITCAAFAQDDARIEGVVLDARTRAPLIATNIFLKEYQRGAFADRDGRFTIINLPPLEDLLVVSHVGYQPREIPVTLAAGEIRILEIFLEPQTLDMDRVTVTASRRSEAEFRTQKAVTIADEGGISIRPASSTADALREMPGILVQKTTAGHGAPIIRGLIGKNILLLYNGVRLNKPIFRHGGNQYLNTVDSEVLSRMEVVRGPGSVLYGSDAIGGMVNLITRPPPFTEGEVHWGHILHTRYTSSDNGRGIHFSLERADSRFSARAGVTTRSIGNLKPGGAIPVQDPTGYDEIAGHLITAFRISSRQTLRIDLLQVNQSEVPRYDQYASGSYETYLYDPQKRFLGMAEYTSLQPAPWLSKVEWNLSWQREHEGRIKQRAGTQTFRLEDDVITTFGTFLQATSLAARRHALRWGAEFYYDRLRSGRKDSLPDTTLEMRGTYPDDSRYRQLGVFLSDDITLTPDTDLTTGVRFSQIRYEAPLEDPWGHYSDSFNNITGNVGVSHRFLSWLNLVFSVSRGFRAPNFNDTVVLTASNYGVDAPSPGLRAETSTNYELGLKTEWNGNDIEVFTYHSSLNNLIERRPGTYNGLPYLDENGNGIQDAEEPLINTKKNVGEAYIQGIEVQGRLRISDLLTVRTNAFYTYGQNRTEKEPMSRIPPLMGLVGIEWKREAITLELFIRAAGEQRRLSARDEEDTRIDPGGTPGWSDWNLRGSRDFGPLRVALIVGNIFDHAYKEHGSGVYNPGRYITISLRWASSG